MQTRNKFLDDMSQLMTNAMGVAQGAKTEAETVDDLGKMVVSRIQLVDGITRTLTCPIVHL